MRRNPLDPRPLFLFFLALLFALPAAAQQFAQPTVIPTGNWPAAIYTADVNGDGYPDLIYIDQGATPAASTTHVLLNDGKGNFSPSATLATAGTSLAVADMSGSGHPDLVWIAATGPMGPNVSNGYTAFIARGKGDGTFASAIFYNAISLSPSPYNPPLNTFRFDYLAAGHFYHRSGPLDLIFQETTQGALCDFTGSFPAGGCIGITPNSPTQLADLSQDGYLDLIALQGSTLTVALGGPGPYSVPPFRYTFSGSSSIHSLLIQDVNFDGRPDLIAEGANGRIDVYPGNGDGTFSTTSIGGTGTLDGLTGNGGHLITVADLNHDGQLDALTATPAGISTLLGAGTSYLQLGGIYNAGPGHTSYAVADFNGDGNLDLAVDSPEGIAILYGNADGTFQTSRAFAAGAPALSGGVGALTATGPPDVVVATGGAQAVPQAQVMVGAGDGTFAFQADAATPTVPLPVGSVGERGEWASIIVADLNRDGNRDFALTADRPAAATSTASTPPGLSVYLGNGDRTFTPQTHIATPESPSSGPFYGVSAAGSVNLPFANLDSQSVQAFYDSGQYNTPPPTAQVVVPEQDLHAHNLLAVGEMRDRNASIHIVAQDQGSLKLIESVIPYYIQGDLAVDGSLTTPGQMVAPDISATFPGMSKALGFRAFPGSMLITSLTGNTFQDLLVVYDNLDADHTAPTAAAPNYLYIWFGSGPQLSTYKFLTSAAHPVNPVRIQLSRNYYQVAVADLNHDGIPDLILSDGYLVSYQLGLGDGTFGPEHHLLAGRGINTLSTADLRGLSTTDLVIANGGAAFSNPVINHETIAADPDVNTGGITVLLNTVTSKTTGLTLNASPEPSVFYSPYTITANTPQDGTVTFSQDGTLLGTVQTVNSVANYTVPPGNEYTPGVHNLAATFVASQSTIATQTTAPHTITRATTTVTLTPTTPLTVYYGQGIDGTFAVTGVDPTHPPTGNYTLLDNGAPVAICTAIPLTRECPYGAPVLLDAGPHVFSLAYLGDTYNAPSISPNYPYSILPDLTNVIATSFLNPSYFGQFTGIHCQANGNFAIPSAELMSFFIDGAPVGTYQVSSNGAAGNSTMNLSVGIHILACQLDADRNFNQSPLATIQQTVLPDLTTSTLTSSLNPATRGTAVTFTATVTGNFLPPSGAVNFLDGTTLLGSGTFGLNPGSNASTTTFTTSTLAVGTHPITAVYDGNASFNPATSAVLQQVIQPVSLGTQASITTLSSNLNPSTPQQLVTFTAQVQVPGVFVTTATGVVTFLDGSTVLGTGSLNGFGIATFQTATLATGTHQITATYPGATSTTAPTILPSASQPLTQIVTIPLVNAPTGFQMTANPAALTLGVGRTGTIAINILDQSGFNQPVALSCANLAPETTCVFLPAVVPAGGGSATLQLLTSAPRDCNTNTPYFLGSNTPLPRWPLAPGGIVTALTLFACRKRRRLARALLLAALAATITLSLSGCGHCTDLGTRPGSYTFQLIGTAQGGPITETRTITIPLTTTIP